MNTRIIIVEIGHNGKATVLGAIADSVKEVLEMDSGSIAPPPDMGGAVKTDFLRGIGNHGDRFVLLLDIAKVLNSDEVFMLDEISRNQSNPAAAEA